jgi:glucose-1-phosphate adenylyltransferase
LHRHIRGTYQFDHFSGGFVEVLSAEQVNGCDPTWYEGTADAVRKNLCYLDLRDDDLVLILAGDHLYRMDFEKMVAAHLDGGMEVTIAAKIVAAEKVSQLGIMEVDAMRRVVSFVEKPKDPDIIGRLCLSNEMCRQHQLDASQSHCLASMGNYVFRFGALKAALGGVGTDFGREILPNLLSSGVSIGAYLFNGYWEDIGTIRTFFDANLALTDIVPPFDFFDADRPIFTIPRYLPASKINGSSMGQVIIAEGCLIDSATLRRCVIGTCSVIRQDSFLQNVLMMGNGFFEKKHGGSDAIPSGIGRNCQIFNTIVDKNVCIGDRVFISPEGKPNGYSREGCSVVDGIVCIPKGTVVPHGFVF